LSDVLQSTDLHQVKAGQKLDVFLNFPVQRYISDKIFVKIQSVVLYEVAKRQTDRQTDKRQVKHDRLGEGNKIEQLSKV